MANPRPLRFVHTSDIHLDAYIESSEERWEHRRTLIRETFQRLLQRTREVEADVLFIAGDVFDSRKARDETVVWFLEQIAALAPLPVVAINGNHDLLGDQTAIYSRHDVTAVPNLHFLLDTEGARVEVNGLDLVCWGRGYDGVHGFRPLEGLPDRSDERWHVALAHGHLVREPHDHYRSLLIHPGEIAASGYDYVALGHWEPHEDVSQPPVAAVYSGAPIPISDANGLAGWIIVGEAAPGQGVRWRAENIDARRGGPWARPSGPA